MHEEAANQTPSVQTIPNKTRTLLLMKEVKRLFFPNHRGKWYTIHETQA